jgi:hypothetical protein
MRRDPYDLIDPETAERMLAGDRIGPRPLVELLSQAAAPARRSELEGEDAAVAAYRTARLVPAHPVRRRFVTTPAWARLVTVKVAAVALALAVGGVALAAGTGLLPSPRPGIAPAQSPSAPAASDRVSTTGTDEDRGAASGQPGQTASLPPSLVGLCHAYLAQAGANPAKAMEKSKFEELVKAAGGTDQVAAFCDALTHQTSSETGNGQSGSDNHPTGPSAKGPAPPSHAPHQQVHSAR